MLHYIHSSLVPVAGNNSDALWHKNGYRKCDSFTQWNTTQLLRMKNILSFAGKWMVLENIILSEVTQTQKDMHGMYSLISGYKPKKKKVQNTQDTVHRTQKGQQAESAQVRDTSVPLGREKKAITSRDGGREPGRKSGLRGSREERGT